MPDLIRVDMGPYASRLYKYDLWHDEEYRLDTSKGLKFLHFNLGNQKKLSKRRLKMLQNRTVAVLALSPQGIKQVSNSFVNLEGDATLFTPMAIGVALVSTDDNYNKSKGRDESVRDITEVDIEVLSINMTKTHIYVNLASYKGVNLTLRLNKKTGFSTVIGSLTGAA